jgi:hypothetical protein
LPDGKRCSVIEFGLESFVALHLIKLCVGADSIEDLAQWQASRIKEAMRRKRKPELMHVTRMMPKRVEELLEGGSIYWVIKGQIAVRQQLLELRSIIRDGGPRCGLVLNPKLVPTKMRAQRAFQGWRYFDGAVAPEDLKGRAREAKIPEALRAELSALGLL